MRNKENEAQKEALKWVVELLQSNEVPFLLCGGLAAIGYGSKRALNDIDIFVLNERFWDVVQLGRDYISKPARHYREKEEGWDLEYVQFDYKNIKIEVGNSKGAKVYDSKIGNWSSLNIDFSQTELKTIFGIEVPLMRRADLIEYKTKLQRPVDMQDIEAIQGNK